MVSLLGVPFWSSQPVSLIEQFLFFLSFAQWKIIQNYILWKFSQFLVITFLAAACAIAGIYKVSEKKIWNRKQDSIHSNTLRSKNHEFHFIENRFSFIYKTFCVVTNATWFRSLLANQKSAVDFIIVDTHFCTAVLYWRKNKIDCS